MKLQTIQLTDIHFEDDFFSLTPTLPRKSTEKLTKSIARVGILHPPILMEIAEGIYRIGSGRKRLLATAILKQTSCKCYVLTATTHPLEVFNYIYEEGSHTDMAIIAKAIFLKKAGQWLSGGELAEKFMLGFNLKATHFHVKKMQDLAKLELNIQEELFRHNIDEKVCHELTKLDFMDRMSLFDIITNLSLSVANQRKLLISSREIAARNKTTIASFLSQQSLTKILTNQTGNTPQRTAQFMHQLSTLRFPLSTRAEEDFKTFVKTLPLKKNMKISHSPSFEKNEMSLTITCTNRAELTALITTISDRVG